MLARDDLEVGAGHPRDHTHQTLAMAKFTVAVETAMLLRNPEEYRKRSRAGGAKDSDDELEVQRIGRLREHEERTLMSVIPTNIRCVVVDVRRNTASVW